jgi:hypothetical protein
MIAPKTNRSDRHGATEVARDDIIGPRIEGLEFGTRGTRESASSKKNKNDSQCSMTRITIHFSLLWYGR